MKIKEPRAMREIHAIRARVWEETKTLSTLERIEKINVEGMLLLRKRGLENRIVSHSAIK